MSDAERIADIIELARNAGEFRAIQREAANKLRRGAGEKWPHNGCGAMLSCLLQRGGIAVSDTLRAFDFRGLLAKRGWTVIPVGDQQAGDVGSTCGPKAHHGTDHVYLVLEVKTRDDMVIADNQKPAPHLRSASGKGKSKTRFFMRAPQAA